MTKTAKTNSLAIAEPQAVPVSARRKRGRPAGKGLSEQHVLDTAFDAFAKRGYEGTTLRAMAQALGVSHNLLHVRFGTKADLWRHAVDARVARSGPPVFDALEAPGLSDTERLRAFVERLCRWAASNGDFAALNNMEGRRATWRNDYLVDAYLRPVKEQLEALLNRVAARQGVSAVSPLGFMSLIVHGIGFYVSAGPTLERLDAADEIVAANVGRQVDAIAALLLRGLLGDEGGR